MIINLLDKNFEHDIGSVAGKPPSYFGWRRDHPSTMNEGITVFTDGYIAQEWLDQVHSPVRIGWLREPQCLWPDNYKRALALADQFDFILTYYQPLLSGWPDKFRFAPYGGIWLPRQTWGIKPKSKNISMLIGEKRSTEGHRLRHEIYQSLQAAGWGDRVDWYGFYGTPVNYGWQTKYRVLADYRYSIVTEACYEANLFTEILLDCFAVGTIPIFWGCPNWYSFGFNVIPFENTDELLWQIRNGRDGEGYPLNLNSVYDNMQAAVPYEITEDWLWQNVLKELV